MISYELHVYKCKRERYSLIIIYRRKPVAPEDDPLWSKHVVLDIN
jgi:hypothetical protein